MSLIGTARALDDQRFLWRVRAAMLNIAVTKFASTDAEDKAFAMSILDFPMEANNTMEALVANNATVSNNVVIDSMNGVNTEAVTDTQIITAVTAFWPSVAKRRAERIAAGTPV